MSFGDLEGKVIPDNVKGTYVEGRSSGAPFKMKYYLSDAVRDALKTTNCDTLIDAEVTNKTGLLVPSNSIIIKGKAIKSEELPTSGGK